MSLLVNFVAVENEIEILIHSEYIRGIYNNLLAARLIDGLVIAPANLRSTSDPIIEDADDNNYYIDFVCKEDGMPNTMHVSFEFRTYNMTKQLDVQISSDNYLVGRTKTYLERLKLEIKRSIVKDWKDIIWLVDKDSECLSIELYPRLYKTENLFRELINRVMNIQYGTAWWDLIVPYGIKDKHRARLREYRAKVSSFNNVDDKLMSIDIDDLAKIITTIRYKWKPTFADDINSLINGVQQCNESKLKELLEKQRTEDINLWKDQFSKYLPKDFLERFNVFSKDRNHIMHNKLLDRASASMIEQNAERIEKDLRDAIDKLAKTVLSEEEKESIEKQKEIEYALLEELDHECKENDAHISIRSSDEIIELFEDCLSEIISDVEIGFRFRNDITIEDDDVYRGNESGTLFTLKSRVDDTELNFKYSMQISTDEGDTSELSISCCTNNISFGSIIQYINGEAEYDSDMGLYMPVKKDEIIGVEQTKDQMISYIEDNLTDYMENADLEDIAESVFCAECGEESVCINENYLPFGKCMVCGHQNSIHKCDRCGAWFNSDIDGEYNEKDGFSMCSTCLERIEQQ